MHNPLLPLLFGLGLISPMACGAGDVEVPDYLAQLKLGHPRILLSPETAKAWASGKPASAPGAEWRMESLKEAEKLLSTPLVRYAQPGNDILNQSRAVMRRTYLLAFARLATGDERFSERLFAELDAAAKLESWRPEISFLATAEMMHAFAIGYDWLYDHWSEEQRETLQEALMRNGLLPAQAAYAGKMGGFAGWNSAHNWNFVCNGSIALGAVALLDKEPAICIPLLTGALDRVKKALAEYGPKGGWAEGFTYWNYSTRYLVLLLDSLDSAFGSTFGLAEFNPGLPHTGYFPIYLTGPTGLPFDFADSELKTANTPAILSLAKRFDNLAFAAYQIPRSMGTVPEILSWGMQSAPDRQLLPLDRVFEKVGVISMRSSWEDPNANFLAIKSGQNGANHGHLDLGSFVFEALGKRWICETDKPSYSLPGYFKTAETGGRWTYYALRAEGHNTLVINPAQKPDQKIKGVATIEKFETSPADVFAVLNLTDAYAPDAKSVRRGFRLLDGRNRLFLRDEIELAEPGTIFWALHHKYEATLSEDRRMVRLKDGDRQLSIHLIEPADAHFTTEPADSRAYPNSHPASSASGFQRISIRLSAIQETHISVCLDPGLVGESRPMVADQTPGHLDTWSLQTFEGAVPAAIEADGMPIPEFSPDIFTYTIHSAKAVQNVSSVPLDTGFHVQNREAVNSLPPQAWFLSAAIGDTSIPSPTYRVVVDPPSVSSALIPGAPPPRKGSAQGPSDGIHLPENVLDGSLATRWSAEGDDVALLIDFEQPNLMAGAAFSFYRGASRRARFSVDTSLDGTTWKPVLENIQSSGKSAALEAFEFSEPVEVRFLRYRGHGSDSSSWNSVTEIVPLQEMPPRSK